MAGLLFILFITCRQGSSYLACCFTAGSPLSFTRSVWDEFIEWQESVLASRLFTSVFLIPCSIPVLSNVEGFDIHYGHCEADRPTCSELVEPKQSYSAFAND
jgi:hypothetical protein